MASGLLSFSFPGMWPAIVFGNRSQDSRTKVYIWCSFKNIFTSYWMDAWVLASTKTMANHINSKVSDSNPIANEVSYHSLFDWCTWRMYGHLIKLIACAAHLWAIACHCGRNTHFRRICLSVLNFNVLYII